MKKSIKALIVAASVAAVVGVGAVSYAAWTGSTDTSVTIDSGMTGQIATVGAITVTPTSASGSVSEGVYTMNPLCPIDQGTAPGDCVKYWEFDLTTAATGGQSVKYTIKGSISKGTGANATDLGSTTVLKWSESEPAAKTDGTAMTSTAADISGTKVYVFFYAEDTDAMNATISLTFEAVAATSTPSES